jgi:hypothetical protein
VVSGMVSASLWDNTRTRLLAGLRVQRVIAGLRQRVRLTLRLYGAAGPSRIRDGY